MEGEVCCLIGGVVEGWVGKVLLLVCDVCCEVVWSLFGEVVVEVVEDWYLYCDCYWVGE